MREFPKRTEYWNITMYNIPPFPALPANLALQYQRLLELKIEFAGAPKIPRRQPRRLVTKAVFLLLAAATSLTAVAAPAGSRVTFNAKGIALVDGKPFFPIGVFTYNIDPTVLAELREVQCNTVLHGFNPDQLNLLHDHSLMAVCETS